MNERLKNARKYLGLSLEFVSQQMNLSRSAISAIESGQRKVTVDELDQFSKLYGVSIDELMYGERVEQSEAEMLDRVFSELPDIDKREITSLIDFKKKHTHLWSENFI